MLSARDNEPGSVDQDFLRNPLDYRGMKSQLPDRVPKCPIGERKLWAISQE